MALQDRQKNLFIRLLDVKGQNNEILPDELDSSFVGRWKILILDSFTKQLITPLFGNSELRRNGVTLHLQISDKREPISGVPAVYFVTPTEQNIHQIVMDCQVPLYDAVYVNFSSALSRELMSSFAQRCVESKCSHRISRVFDCYLGGVSLEQTLFSFQIPHVYSVINHPHSSPDDVESIAGNQIPHALFSQLVALSVIPTIRFSPNGAASMVARSLYNLIREEVRSVNNLFQKSRSNTTKHLRHPLLVIIDRDCDLFAPIQHTSSYQALISDLLPYMNNRVIIPDSTSYYLDKSVDTFWNQYAFALFPEAIEANKTSTEDIMKRVEAVRKMTAGTAPNQQSNETSQTDMLKSAVENLPELLERKKQLEKHTTILKSVMECINKREVPHFYELELLLRSDPRGDLSSAISFIKEKGYLEDKVRLMCVCAITRDRDALNPMENAFAEYVQGLSSAESAQANQMLKAYHYFKSFRLTKTASEKTLSPTLGTNRTSLLSKATEGFMSLARAQVKTLLGDDERGVVTQLIDDLSQCKVTALTENYSVLDPVAGKTSVPADYLSSTNKPVFEDIIVYVVGGGSYGEYQNIQTWAGKQNPPRTVIYGSDSILSPSQFIPEFQNSYCD